MFANRTFEALAHERRREVLSALREHQQMSAGQIAEHLGVPRPTLSGHLNVLKSADLIVGERDRTTIWYRLNLSVMEETAHLIFSLLTSQNTTFKIRTAVRANLADHHHTRMKKAL